MVNLLTPNDVHNTQFNVRHLQGGYDMDEVDIFLEDVEATIRTLTNWVPSQVPRRKQRYRYVRRKRDMNRVASEAHKDHIASLSD